MIQHKPIHAAPPRLQGMLLHMQKYDYTIVYKPGKDMVLADHLSHFSSNTNYLPIPLTHNIQHVQLSTSELDVIRGAVECDPVYSTVYHLILRGWPDQAQDVPHIARHFWDARDECSLIVVYSSRRQGSAFHLNSSKGHLLTCMGPIKVLIGCKLGQERLCIGQA